MIIVTGAAGFIGSCLIKELNAHNFNRIVAVDDFSSPAKAPNLVDKVVSQRVERNDFFNWLDKNADEVEFIFHLGARTDTTEQNREMLWSLNTDYSKKVWQVCCERQIPMVYASSAATYGGGENGYQDSNDTTKVLTPLNAYGDSKQAFDLWVLEQEKKPFFWAGLKFFNVYGPNEFHKGRMASVVYHAFRQIQETGKMKLFRSHHPEFENGEQQRDFIYVKDVVQVLYWLMHHRDHSGIYNLGTGMARTFLDLTRAVFGSMGQEPQIEFVDTPADIRDTYQYFTEANMEKLRSVGYTDSFSSLEEGIADYVRNYLLTQKNW